DWKYGPTNGARPPQAPSRTMKSPDTLPLLRGIGTGLAISAPTYLTICASSVAHPRVTGTNWESVRSVSCEVSACRRRSLRDLWRAFGRLRHRLPSSSVAGAPPSSVQTAPRPSATDGMLPVVDDARRLVPRTDAVMTDPRLVSAE